MSTILVGSAPDSWGVWFPDDPKQTPYTRFLDEVADSGYRWIELGPYGYLPTDPQKLSDELASRNLREALLRNSLTTMGIAVGVASLVRSRDETLGGVAAAIGVLAAFCGALANMLVGFNVAAAATAHTSPTAAPQVAQDTVRICFGVSSLVFTII